MSFLGASCPYCGESVELSIDESGGDRQSYVEDCPVCCAPWQVEISRDSDADWNAVLRTTDD
ncbi:MAG TPA: CPXCG motif-containing cysteine-rich protein [Thermoanaerobaculia bacterium]|nr:CPXCG motif-containing cysteine-rich protein [Thermoanaerobaculia bacterium]